jgi:hypothetical protein
MSPIIAGVAAFFSVAAFIFYVIAASGYSKDQNVLKGCQWFYYDGTQEQTDYYYGYDYKFYFGLKGVLYSVPKYDYRYFYYYGSSSDDTLDKCDSSGKSAIGLTVVACIFSFITIITNGAGGVSEETVVKAVGAVLSIIACLFGMIAVGVFMTTCYNKFYDDIHDSNDDASNTDDLHYGNGSILALTALFCNFFAFILAIVNIIAGGSSPLADQK